MLDGFEVILAVGIEMGLKIGLAQGALARITLPPPIWQAAQLVEKI